MPEGQDPLHRGPGDRVAEVRERAADPRVAPPRIVDRHPDHELGDVLSGHWSTSTSAGAAIVFLGDQSPVPTQDRIRGDDARDLRQDPPAEFVTAHSESTTLGVRQAKRPRAQVFSEDPILLPEIVDQIVLVTVHPASEREDEELQRRRHSLRLLGRLDQHRPSLGRFFAPYAVAAQLVGHEPHGFLSLTVQQSAEESPRCPRVPTRLYEDVDQITVLIHRAPEILALTVDRHEDFIQEPRISESTLSALQLPSVVGAEFPAPLPNGFVRHDDSSFGKQILNIPGGCPTDC